MSLRLVDRIKPRTFTGLKGHALTERMRYDQNIGKQNRRIETKSPDRLQRYLRGKFWIEAQIEKASGLFANCPVFRQVSTRLPHQPDRRNAEAFARQYAEDGFVRSDYPTHVDLKLNNL